MENNNDDYAEDECNLMYSSVLSVIEIFTLKNREYFKLDAGNVKNLRKIKNKEKEIEIIIDNIKKKYSYLAIIKECKSEYHSKLAFDLDHIFDDNKRMMNSFNREKSAKSKITEKYENNKEIEHESSEDDHIENKNLRHISTKDLRNFNINNNQSNKENVEKEKISLNKNDDKNKSISTKISKNNEIPFDKSYEFIFIEENKANLNKKEKEKEIEQMEFFQANALGEIDIIALEEIIENSIEYKGDEEFRKGLIHLKNQIQSLSVALENGIVQTNEKLDLISDDIKIADVNVDEINNNLLEAAIEKNKYNKVKYPLILGGIGSSLGIIVPGLGSIIGGSIGSVLGYYLSKLEKKQIDKINPNIEKK